MNNTKVIMTIGITFILVIIMTCVIAVCPRHCSPTILNSAEGRNLLDSVYICHDNDIWGTHCFGDFSPKGFLRGKSLRPHFVVSDRNALDSLVCLILHKRRVFAREDYEELDPFYSMLLHFSEQIDTMSFSIVPGLVQINRKVYEDLSGELFLWCFDRCFEHDNSDSWGAYSFWGAAPRDSLLAFIQSNTMNDLLPYLVSEE